jgi:hypothetical protein
MDVVKGDLRVNSAHTRDFVAWWDTLTPYAFIPYPFTQLGKVVYFLSLPLATLYP